MSFQQTFTQAALIASLFLPSIVQGAYWSPHLGADFKYWNAEPAIGPESDFNLLFPKIGRAANIYVGTRINGYFGVDFGYEQSSKSKNYKVFDGTEIFFVSQEAAGDAATVDLRLHALHLDFNFYWEVARRFEIDFMLGLLYLHPATHIMHLTDGNWLEFRNRTQEKWSGTYGIGVVYTPIDAISIRALFNIDQTKRINYVGFDQNNQFYSISPYTTAKAINVGVIWNILPPRRTKTCVEFDYR